MDDGSFHIPQLRIPQMPAGGGQRFFQPPEGLQLTRTAPAATRAVVPARPCLGRRDSRPIDILKSGGIIPP